MFVLLDCDRYAPVRPNIDARDCATAIDDALDGALDVSLCKLGLRHDCHAVLEVREFRSSVVFPATTKGLPANPRLEIQGSRVACPPHDARESASSRPKRRASQAVPFLSVRRSDAPAASPAGSEQMAECLSGCGSPRIDVGFMADLVRARWVFDAVEAPMCASTTPCEEVRRSLRKFIYAHDIARGSSELLAIKAADPDLWKRRSTNMRNLAALAEE